MSALERNTRVLHLLRTSYKGISDDEIQKLTLSGLTPGSLFLSVKALLKGGYRIEVKTRKVREKEKKGLKILRSYRYIATPSLSFLKGLIPPSVENLQGFMTVDVR